jgi:hypothetical protein
VSDRNYVITMSEETYDVIVTAKIRLFETIDDTIAFMQRLQEAGAAAITGIPLLTSPSLCTLHYSQFI